MEKEPTPSGQHIPQEGNSVSLQDQTIAREDPKKIKQEIEEIRHTIEEIKKVRNMQHTYGVSKENLPLELQKFADMSEPGEEEKLHTLEHQSKISRKGNGIKKFFSFFSL